MSAPTRIAIVGSGPAGFYAAEALSRGLPDCRIDIFERLPFPFGLVRYGVAPDHQKLKQVALVFDRVAFDPRIELMAGVEIGRDITLEALRRYYHAVTLATGTPQGRQLGIDGEALPQIFTSSSFVGWYNGHPEHVGVDPDLGVESVAVVGNGNVAIDVCRMLARPLRDLQSSDIPEPMLAAFAKRQVREIHVIGRGGPDTTKFAFKEFRELFGLPGVRICVPQARELERGLWPAENGEQDAARVSRLLRQSPAAAPSAGGTIINFWFFARPRAFAGTNHLTGIVLAPSDAARALNGLVPPSLACGLAVTCIGYNGCPIAGLEHDPRTGLLAHRSGQVVDARGNEVSGVFAVGWIKRGPTGVIGTNRADASETAATLIARLPELMRGRAVGEASSLASVLKERSIRTISAEQWRALDRFERQRGAALGKPREKLLSFVEVTRLLDIAETARSHVQ